MNTGRGRFLLVCSVVLLAVALIFLVEFRLASSSTSTQSGISKFTAGVPQGDIVSPPARVLVVVEGSGQLAAALKREMGSQPGQTLGVAGVEVVDSFASASGQPVAVLGISESDVRWTPVYARAALNVSVAYASDGDMAWRDESPVRMGRMDGGPQIRVRGDISVADTTAGLISEPAYRHHLAEQVAAIAGAALKQQLAK